MKRFATFSDFYPVYLAMHSNAVCRRLHVTGNVLAIGALILSIVTRDALFLIGMPAMASGCAWIGHVFFQKNRPGVLHYPIYGTLGSWAMTRDVLTGKIAW